MLKPLCLMLFCCLPALAYAQSVSSSFPAIKRNGQAPLAAKVTEEEKPSVTSDVKVVETATLTPEEMKEGRAMLAMLNTLNERKTLAQRVIEQAGNSPEARVLAYQERDRVTAEQKAREVADNKWVARVQSRTGCIDCAYFDFEKGIIQKTPPEQK